MSTIYRIQVADLRSGDSHRYRAWKNIDETTARRYFDRAFHQDAYGGERWTLVGPGGSTIEVRTTEPEAVVV